jgi:hypothetical protein
MVSFGDSKHEPVKPLQSLLNAIPLKLTLSAKCTIHDVCALHEQRTPTSKLEKKLKNTNFSLAIEVGGFFQRVKVPYTPG